VSPRRSVADVMVADIVTLTQGIAINRALALLLERRISGAPVLDETGELTGILTKKDCFKAALHASYYMQWGGSVADYMSRHVTTMDADLDIVSAAETFLNEPYRIFPVLADGQLAGIVSRSDVLRAFLEPRGN
jgi:CBS domain-containing protein